MLIDCELMGSERRLELCVPDVEQAWSFYRDIMGAREVFRSEPRTGDPSRIGFTIGKTGFTITSPDNARSGDGRPIASLLAADLGATFAAIVVYVQDPVTAARRAIDAGSRRRPEAASGTPTHRGHPVEVIIDPFGNSWALAKS
ncbi:MAG TPA: VOC family protein [Acetobacteraceae bacterium]|nr:VOC family protein [Acetobacteraceae bacterium]